MSIWGDNFTPRGGVFGQADPTPQGDARLAFASQMLAGAGGGQGNFAEIMGKALLASRQARMQTREMEQQRKAQEQDQQYRQAQMQHLAAQSKALNNRDTQFGNIDVDQFTPESLAAFQKSGDYGVLQRRPDANLGNFNPGDYTPQSFAKFRQTGKIEDLMRWVAPATPTVFTNGGVPTLLSPDRNTGTASTTPLSTLGAEAGAAATIKGAEATAGAAGAVTGAAGAQAQVDLPNVEATAKQVQSTIDQLIGHPGLPFITGVASKAPIVPGTNQAGADAFAKQVEGQAFLQAFQSLKGGGAITVQEGEAATAAIGRLQRAQRTEDYKKALTELRNIASFAVERARKKAGAPGEAAPAAKVRRFNPETGRIE